MTTTPVPTAARESAARAALDAHVRATIRWHFSRETGTPVWLAFAESCGFANEATLRHHFRNHLGVSPAAYREKFGRPAA